MMPNQNETAQVTLLRVLDAFTSDLEEWQIFSDMLDEVEAKDGKEAMQAMLDAEDAPEELPPALAEALLYLVVYMLMDTTRRMSLHVDSDIWGWFYMTFEQDDPVWRYIVQRTDEPHPEIPFKP